MLYMSTLRFNHSLTCFNELNLAPFTRIKREIPFFPFIDRALFYFEIHSLTNKNKGFERDSGR